MTLNILHGRLFNGFYIGDRQIVACQLAKSRKGFSLKKILFFEIEPELINRRGIITDPTRLAYLIKKDFSNNNFRPKQAALSLGGFLVSFKKLLIENPLDTDVKRLIFAEAQKHIPFDLKEAYFDFNILEPYDNKEKAKEVLIAAAKKDIVDSYILLLKKLSVRLTVIDIDIFALYNAYILNYGISDKAILLMDINYKRTLFIVIKNKYPLCLLEMPAEYPNNGADEFEDTIRHWHLKIENAVELFYSEHPREKIDKAILSGECANFEAAKELAKNIANNVDIFDPFKRININRNIFGYSSVKKAAPYAGICIGLASRDCY
ncbi:MAG: pilus assembly protein PilM [Deltaproteobacteria bacterium]|nr:pilus assembly protein PilM [Deltaproteobacteria bacterium]